jgi:endonuclease YncB( thermonuclease family)
VRQLKLKDYFRVFFYTRTNEMLAAITRRINRARLRNIVPSEIKTFSFHEHKTYAKVSNVYDGDTIHLTFFYRNQPVRARCRLALIDAPEIKGETDNEREAAVKVRDYLRNLIDNKIVLAHLGRMDKYGRPLVDVYLNGLYINQHLMDKGYAKQYDGGKKEDWAGVHSGI